MNSVKKVIVIGLDGLEPKIVSSLLNAGELPNLKKLRQQGGFSTVQTTYPAQTPVAWSTFATGVNPGGHGIFDFVSRNPKTYLPDFALNRFEKRSSFLPPKAVNSRGGKPMWEVLAEAGMESTILRCPCTFPPDSTRGQMLAGMGVSDVRGGLGTSSFYSSDPKTRARESENVIHLKQKNGAIKTHLLGPRNTKTNSDSEFDITVEVEASQKRIVIKSKGQPKNLVVREGEWSDWLHVKFKTGPLQSVRGVVRFHLVRIEPFFELYASPVNFDPNAVLLYPISSPPEYARDLAKAIGTFYTTGMVEDHTGLNNERFDEAAYLQQCDIALRDREKMMLHELQRFDRGLFFCLFDTPDRVQHMFWRFREKEHPANNGRTTADMTHVIEEHYRRCDEIVGKALRFADDSTLFITLSDHGFGSFQRGIHLNTWLHDNGFLTLKNGIKPGEDNGNFFPNVDWSRSKAYSLGLGSIYLNLAGREGKGIIKPQEVDAVKTAIAEGLSGLNDEARGQTAIRNVVKREEIYSGAYAEDAPDLIVNFAPGYRVSWATGLGGIPAGHFEDNTKKWSGDHIVAPDSVPGALFMNRKYASENASLVDMAPTIVSALGVAGHPYSEGQDLINNAGAKSRSTGVPTVSSERKATAPANEDDESSVRERLKGLGYLS